MSVKFANGRVINAGAMTGTDVLTSDVSCIEGLGNCSYQMVWTGTPTGTWTVEVSNNYVKTGGGTATGDWTTLTLASPPTAPAGSASSTAVDLNGLPYRHVRLKYTNSASTGTLSVYFHGKGL